MLPMSFHQTFIPERRLIASILDYSTMGKKGNYQEIASDTGIPMGASSGKVPAILAYAEGMGLIEISKRGSVKKPTLTCFGQAVHAADKYLSGSIVQWLVHMNLCRSDIGAIVWNAVFAQGRNIIGSSFSRDQLEEYLVSILGKGKRRIGPLLSTYAQDAGLLRANILSVKGDRVVRHKAPIQDSYADCYSAYLLTLYEAHFNGQYQITVSDFNEKTFWLDIRLWSQSDIELVFSFIERRGYISIDRQMLPWIIERNAKSEQVWPIVWSKMV